MSERWKPIPIEGAEGYEVSDQGAVRSNKLGQPQLRRLSPDRTGYPALMLYLRGKGHKNYRVATLVLLAFIGPKPGPEYHASHCDGDPLNNRLSNLVWETARSNMRRRTPPVGVLNPSARLDPDKVREIKRRIQAGEKDHRIAYEYDVSPGAIYAIRTGRTWTSVA